MLVLVRGIGDIGSAVAHVLFRAGHEVVVHDLSHPTAPRRGMAFADALFDGNATLAGVTATRVNHPRQISDLLALRAGIPATAMCFEELLSALRFDVVVDARMRKRDVPEIQRGCAPLTVGLGPNFVAEVTVDVAIETSWEQLGQIVWSGPTLAFAGEPRAILGIGRARFVYAPVDGIFRTAARIGAIVGGGSIVARLDEELLTAHIGGMLRGLTHDGVPVRRGTKVIEVDPRGPYAKVFGLGERPRCIAEAVLDVVRWPSVTLRAACSPSAS